MTLVGGEIVRRCKPVGVEVLRITRHAPRDRTGVDRLAVDVPPEVRQRVVAAEIDARAKAIVHVRAERRVVPLEDVRVLDQLQIELLPDFISDLTRRRIDAVGIEIGELSVDEIRANRTASTELPADAGRELPGVRR